MLVLTRDVGEIIMIGDDIQITLIEVRGRELRIGIDAPRHIPIHRLEVYARIQKEKAQGSGSDEPPTKE